jgi:hypothetical protein
MDLRLGKGREEYTLADAAKFGKPVQRAK